MSSMLQPIRQIFKNLVQSGNFNSVLSKATIISAGDGKLTAEMVLSEEHLNASGTLHGGLTAMIVDEMSSLALTSSLLAIAEEQSSSRPSESPKSRIGSVSVDLSVSYLNPAKNGDTILIEAETLKQGKTLAFLGVKIINKTNGRLIATGKHTKFILSKL